jgi:hypothetical protein
MSGNTFGTLFSVTNFGESHGLAIGCVIDGCPPGMTLSESDIQPDLDRRRPGTSKFVTQRNEPDSVQIISGVYEGKTTGTPICLLIQNTDQRSKDYGNILQTFRPGHADYTYWRKYGLRDPRGGGRSSARLTAPMVAIAQKRLAPFPTVSLSQQNITELSLNEKHELAFSYGGVWYFVIDGDKEPFLVSHIADEKANEGHHELPQTSGQDELRARPAELVDHRHHECAGCVVLSRDRDELRDKPSHDQPVSVEPRKPPDRLGAVGIQKTDLCIPAFLHPRRDVRLDGGFVFGDTCVGRIGAAQRQ